MTARVAILISGSGSNMMSLIEGMQAPSSLAAPCLVLSNKPDAGGLDKARGAGVAAECISHRAFGSDRAGFELALHHRLEKAQPDVICLAGFMRILSATFVEKWQGKILNIHPSLLPLYKGLHTHERAIEAGDLEHGCTVHEVTAALDDGPIWGQARVRVSPEDTPETLAQKVLGQEHRLYPAVLQRFVAKLDSPLMICADEEISSNSDLKRSETGL